VNHLSPEEEWAFATDIERHEMIADGRCPPLIRERIVQRATALLIQRQVDLATAITDIKHRLLSYG
jgi:hypothetical protein